MRRRRDEDARGGGAHYRGRRGPPGHGPGADRAPDPPEQRPDSQEHADPHRKHSLLPPARAPRGADRLHDRGPLALGVQPFRYVDDQVAFPIPVGESPEPVRQVDPLKVDHDALLSPDARRRIPDHHSYGSPPSPSTTAMSSRPSTESRTGAPFWRGSWAAASREAGTGSVATVSPSAAPAAAAIFSNNSTRRMISAWPALTPATSFSIRRIRWLPRCFHNTLPDPLTLSPDWPG